MTEREFRLLVAEAYRDGQSLPSDLRAMAAAAVAASVDGASSKHQRAQLFAVVTAIAIAILVVSTLVAARALHREEAPASPSTHSTPPTSQVLTSQAVSWGTAQADSPDPLLVPGWLPFPGNRASNIQETKGPDGHAIETISEYRSTDGRSVLIQQNHQHAFNVSVPGPTTQGKIGGKPATFYEFVDGTPTAVIWRLADGNYVDVVAMGLSTAELTRVCEALHT